MMSDGYFLGVDVGSASVRAGLYSAQGERLSFATRPISQFHASNARGTILCGNLAAGLCGGAGSRRLLWDFT